MMSTHSAICFTLDSITHSPHGFTVNDKLRERDQDISGCQQAQAHADRQTRRPTDTHTYTYPPPCPLAEYYINGGRKSTQLSYLIGTDSSESESPSKILL